MNINKNLILSEEDSDYLVKLFIDQNNADPMINLTPDGVDQLKKYFRTFLTPRVVEILTSFHDGDSSKKIGKKLGISSSKVEKLYAKGMTTVIFAMDYCVEKSDSSWIEL